MSNSNRAAKITKAYKVLKKHYKPIEPSSDRSLLEHMLYACCLENARYETADEAFAKLQESYFDWNEIRVTTVSELSEVMSDLPDPVSAAARLKRTLQSIFETHYAFDIEFLRKQNLGKAVQELEKFDRDNLFAVAYVTQAGLGGHSIPLSRSALEALQNVGVITEAEAKSGRVPGLERTISKSKGIEFASLLQQLAAEYHAGPNSKEIRAILQEIDPTIKDRFAKSSDKKQDATGASKPAAAKKKRATPTAPKKAVKAKKTEGSGAKKPPAAAKKSKPAATKKPASKSLTKKKPR